MKESEGDPHLKQQRKQAHAEWSQRNQAAAARGANALIVNPTHVAIAIDFEPGRCPVPTVSAKGEDHVARAMREAAGEAGVPIIDMGSAVSSVFGGGGAGGILGAVGGIVGGIFGGPIGSMIGQAVGNLLQQAIGEGLQDGIGKLVQDHGMPKFLANDIKATIGSVLDGLTDHSVDAHVQRDVNGQLGDFRANLASEISRDFVGAVLQIRQAGGEEGGSGGGGWLQAIAKAMGKTLGAKAEKMVELSNKMSELQKNTNSGNAEADKKNANEFNQTMTEFQATGQEYSMLNSVFSTAIKSLGEALSSMARKHLTGADQPAWYSTVQPSPDGRYLLAYLKLNYRDAEPALSVFDTEGRRLGTGLAAGWPRGLPGRPLHRRGGPGRQARTAGPVAAAGQRERPWRRHPPEPRWAATAAGAEHHAQDGQRHRGGAHAAVREPARRQPVPRADHAVGRRPQFAAGLPPRAGELVARRWHRGLRHQQRRRRHADERGMAQLLLLPYRPGPRDVRVARRGPECSARHAQLARRCRHGRARDLQDLRHGVDVLSLTVARSVSDARRAGPAGAAAGPRRPQPQAGPPRQRQPPLRQDPERRLQAGRGDGVRGRHGSVAVHGARAPRDRRPGVARVARRAGFRLRRYGERQGAAGRRGSGRPPASAGRAAGRCGPLPALVDAGRIAAQAARHHRRAVGSRGAAAGGERAHRVAADRAAGATGARSGVRHGRVVARWPGPVAVGGGAALAARGPVDGRPARWPAAAHHARRFRVVRALVAGCPAPAPQAQQRVVDQHDRPGPVRVLARAGERA
ncbi:hypothetical protein OSTOST_08978 [Ostertagia ostertagi]